PQCGLNWLLAPRHAPAASTRAPPAGLATGPRVARFRRRRPRRGVPRPRRHLAAERAVVVLAPGPSLPRGAAAQRAPPRPPRSRRLLDAHSRRRRPLRDSRPPPHPV